MEGLKRAFLVFVLLLLAQVKLVNGTDLFEDNFNYEGIPNPQLWTVFGTSDGADAGVSADGNNLICNADYGTVIWGMQGVVSNSAFYFMDFPITFEWELASFSGNFCRASCYLAPNKEAGDGWGPPDLFLLQYDNDVGGDKPNYIIISSKANAEPGLGETIDKVTVGDGLPVVFKLILDKEKYKFYAGNSLKSEGPHKLSKEAFKNGAYLYLTAGQHTKGSAIAEYGYIKVSSSVSESPTEERSDASPAKGVFNTIEITNLCNRSFRGDKGGWIRQGSNDMRNIPIGLQTFQGTPFEIIDPEKNKGNSCILLGPGTTDKVKIEIEKKANSLFFLHTSAWNTGGIIGSYIVHLSPYPKDLRQEYEEKMGVGRMERKPLETVLIIPLDSSNIADWWNPSQLDEAKVGWEGQSGQGQDVGTYVYEWNNPFPGYWVASIEFTKEPKVPAAPILLAITAKIEGEVEVKVSPDIYARLYQIKEGLKELDKKVAQHMHLTDKYYRELGGIDKYFENDAGNWQKAADSLKKEISDFNDFLQERAKIFMSGGKVTFSEEKEVFDQLKIKIENTLSTTGINDEKGQKKSLQYLMEKLNAAIVQIGGLRPTQAYYAGRRALFLLEISQRYSNFIKSSLKEGKFEKNYLFYAARGLTCAQQALKLLEDPQAKIERKMPEREISFPESLGPQQEICLDGKWQCNFDGEPDKLPVNGWLQIYVPHSTDYRTLPSRMGLPKEVGSYPKHSLWYKTEFSLPEDWGSNLVKVYFEAVTHYAEVYLNGIYCGNHVGSFTPFEVDITSAVQPGKSNLLTVYLRDGLYSAVTDNPWQNFYARYFVTAHPYQNIGIQGDVYLKSYPLLFISKNLIDTFVEKEEIQVRTYITNGDNIAHEVSVANLVKRKGKEVLKVDSKTITVPPNSTVMVSMKRKWSDFEPWGIGGEYGNPTLYFLETTLAQDKNLIDRKYTRFGFREFKIKEANFSLNNKKIFLQDGGVWYGFFDVGGMATPPLIFRLFNAYRKANSNMVRNFTPARILYFNLADELGMLCENQWAFWDIRVPGDDYDDPVWVENVKNEYQEWIEKDYNHPSVVLWSSNNEVFAADTSSIRPALQRFIDFHQFIHKVDLSNRPVDSHGNQGFCDNPGFEIVNLHYPPLDRLDDWQEKYGGRPVILGEFYGSEGVRCQMLRDPNPEVAAKAEEEIAKNYAEEINYAKARNLPGISPHSLLNGFFCPSSLDKMGPWADLFKKPLTEYTEFWWSSAPVPVNWPALSGIGTRPSSCPNSPGDPPQINWFDPGRVEYTPNKVFYAILDSFRPMPPLKSFLPPEVLVEVAGASGKNTIVFISPEDGQATNTFGVKADEEGKAWFFLKEPGKYKIFAEAGGRQLSTVINTKEWNINVSPGYSYLQRVQLQ